MGRRAGGTSRAARAAVTRVISTRFLDPVERSLEVLFGLIMVLVITASIDTVSAGDADVNDVLLAALGCNLAWGVIDAVMYLMASYANRARGLTVLRAIRATPEASRAQQLIAALLPRGLAVMLGPPELEPVRQRLTATRETPRGALLYDDYMAALGVFLLVFLSTLPVIAPFLFMSDTRAAVRVSQVIGAVMLFAAGWSLGVFTGRSGWHTGVVMMSIGGVLAAMTFVLGG